MKYSEIANLDVKELRTKAHQLRKELFESRIKLKMQRLSDSLTIRRLRRDIARLQTAVVNNKRKK